MQMTTDWNTVAGYEVASPVSNLHGLHGLEITIAAYFNLKSKDSLQVGYMRPRVNQTDREKSMDKHVVTENNG